MKVVTVGISGTSPEMTTSGVKVNTVKAIACMTRAVATLNPLRLGGFWSR